MVVGSLDEHADLARAYRHRGRCAGDRPTDPGPSAPGSVEGIVPERGVTPSREDVDLATGGGQRRRVRWHQPDGGGVPPVRAPGPGTVADEDRAAEPGRI